MGEKRELYVYVGFLCALPAFAWTWVECIQQYGLLIGVGLGWLPALVVALIETALWPLSLAISALVGLSGGANSALGEFFIGIGLWQTVFFAILIAGGAVGALAHGAVALEEWSERGASRRRFWSVAAVFPIAVIALGIFAQFS